MLAYIDSEHRSPVSGNMVSAAASGMLMFFLVWTRIHVRNQINYILTHKNNVMLKLR